MRGIVRKILAASRFDLEIHEAGDSTATLERLRNGDIGLVFLDYNMPGLNGADILSGLKRHYPEVAIVMMGAELKRGVSGRPHLSRALAMLKKPFLSGRRRCRAPALFRRARAEMTLREY